MSYWRYLRCCRYIFNYRREQRSLTEGVETCEFPIAVEFVMSDLI